MTRRSGCLLAVLLGITLLGCAVAGVRWITHDPLGDRGTPIPRPAVQNPSPSWSPSPHPGFDNEDDMRYDVERRTLDAAGAYRPMTSECRPGYQGCTVTFGGIEVAWTVTVTTSTRILVAYHIDAAALAVTGESVHANLAYRYPGARDLRCDDLPDVFLAPKGRPYGPRCYVVQDRFDDSRRVDIVAAEGGVGFREVDE
ncbi:hypothetical protein AB0M02_38830 [Actinoplanes sp. NPDC051861]|uniref:hypothetical protein n=1 Tax=Actinoplanes sp. NPDC051861 TaxID=3155170 RepID=UPI00341E14A2